MLSVWAARARLVLGTIKDNHPIPLEAMQLRFSYLREYPFEEANTYLRTCHDKGHGHLATRACELIALEPNDPLWGDF